MISISRLTIRHGATIALADFSGSFVPGTISALIGGDGAGKTSLLRYLALHSGLSKTVVTYQGAASGVWNNLSVLENLRFVADSYRVSKSAAKTRIPELVAAAGLTGAERRLGFQLSGGMRQKLGVIMAMLPRPELLLLDEPTTGVDPDSRVDLGKLIRRAAAEGATVVLATTYLDEAEPAEQVFLLDRGRLLAAGSPQTVIAQTPGRVWVEAESGSRPDPGVTWQRGRDSYRWTSTKTRPTPTATPAQLDLELATIATLLAAEDRKRLPDPAPLELPRRDPGQPLIEGSLISKRFGNLVALDQVSITVNSGEIVGLIGGNGAGKSTLIRLLLGLDKPQTGGVAILGGPPKAARREIGYVPQSLGLYPTLLAQENLDFTTDVFGSPRRTQTGISASLSVDRLPLGARRNLAVECALSHEPQLLILDEPSSGMDPLSRMRLWQRLRQAADLGVGVLVTTHYQQEAQQCDRLVRLESGQVVDH